MIETIDNGLLALHRALGSMAPRRCQDFLPAQAGAPARTGFLPWAVSEPEGSHAQ